jgi:hypothetical protein
VYVVVEVIDFLVVAKRDAKSVTVYADPCRRQLLCDLIKICDSFSDGQRVYCACERSRYEEKVTVHDE